MEKSNKIAVVGTVGIPANYGGFETLVENLAKYHDSSSLDATLTVYCSRNNYISRKQFHYSARLRYVPLNANGIQSIIYDVWSLLSAVRHRNSVILLLGVSGAIALPIVRLISSARVLTNIDGIEWRREKWQGLAKHFLRLSEKIAVRFSHEVISDNGAIAEYISETYGLKSHVIAYGGDHATRVSVVGIGDYLLPPSFAFSVCRIEPENNVEMIVEAFSKLGSHPLVMVGNWNNSEYGRSLRDRFSNFHNLYLLDPIYDLGKLKSLRSQMSFYLHGHSAGGTNPSLVEAMHFGKPVLAFDCAFNRNTTENKARFFKSHEDLVHLMRTIDSTEEREIGDEMLEIAKRRYTWDIVAKKYFSLCGISVPEKGNVVPEIRTA